jgi:hypothetical protein
MRLDLSHQGQADDWERGERPVPPSALAPETALGSVPTVALPSAQGNVVLAPILFTSSSPEMCCRECRVKTPSILGNILR